MKNLYPIAFLLIGMIALSSCSKEECLETDLNDIIIGTWEVQGSDVTFNADGSLSDPDNVFEGEINGIQLLNKSYELEGDSILDINLSNSNPPAALGFILDIDSYDCNEIKTSGFFVSFNFKKK